ncbi:uncharacterized protein METZ01_LOCUS325763, partial [marine metagenome]
VSRAESVRVVYKYPRYCVEQQSGSRGGLIVGAIQHVNVNKSDIIEIGVIRHVRHPNHLVASCGTGPIGTAVRKP